MERSHSYSGDGGRGVRVCNPTLWRQRLMMCEKRSCPKHHIAINNHSPGNGLTHFPYGHFKKVTKEVSDDLLNLEISNLYSHQHQLVTSPHASSAAGSTTIACNEMCIPINYLELGSTTIASNKMCIPIIWRLLSPTRFPGSLLGSGKHWTLVPSSAEVAVPLRVAVKDVTFAPNPAPAAAMKALPGPHEEEAPASLWNRGQSLIPLPTLQTVNPFMSPLTVQLKVKVSPGQVGGAGVNCPATSPGVEIHQQCTKVYTYQNRSYHAFYSLLNAGKKNYVWAQCAFILQFIDCCFF